MSAIARADPTALPAICHGDSNQLLVAEALRRAGHSAGCACVLLMCFSPLGCQGGCAGSGGGRGALRQLPRTPREPARARALRRLLELCAGVAYLRQGYGELAERVDSGHVNAILNGLIGVLVAEVAIQVLVERCVDHNVQID